MMETCGKWTHWVSPKSTSRAYTKMARFGPWTHLGFRPKCWERFTTSRTWKGFYEVAGELGLDSREARGPGGGHIVRASLVANTQRLHINYETTFRKTANLCRLLDDGVPLTALGVLVPIDPVIGLVPVLGDILSLVLGLTLLAHAQAIKVPRRVQARMAVNLVFDACVGAIPLIGDIVDFIFKANVRNLKLMEDGMAMRSCALNSPAISGME